MPPRRAPSRPVDASRVAATPRIVRVEIGDTRIDQVSLYETLELTAVYHLGVDHEVVGVEGAQRNRPNAHHVRDFVDAIVGRARALQHENGMAGAVRVVGRLMGVVEEKHGLARLGVSDLDPIGKPGLGVHLIPDDPKLAQLIGRQAEKMTEGLRVEARNAECHDTLLARTGVWRILLREALPSHPIFALELAPP